MSTLPIQSSLDAGTVTLAVDTDRDPSTPPVELELSQDECRAVAVRLRALANHRVAA